MRPRYYSSSTQRWSLKKCASEERNIEEVRHEIKVSNHSATRLVRFWQKPKQGHCLLFVAMETTQSCQTGTCKTRWTGDDFVMTGSPLTTQPPVTIQTASPPISTGNIGKWLSEIIFGWKNYISQNAKIQRRRGGWNFLSPLSAYYKTLYPSLSLCCV